MSSIVPVTSPAPLSVLAGRYVIGDVIGRGGAATVHLGKPVGEGRRGVVAIKRLHPHLAEDPAFLAMMLDEARLLSRVRHPNVVATLDVVLEGGQLFLVMEYVHGVTLGMLLGRAHAKRARAPVGVACAIARDALLGLHAAHEAAGPGGEPLGMVHRDVSPQNLLVAESGVLKVVDFGIAKAAGRVQQTENGTIKGKLGYMPPEQLHGDALDRRADVFAAGVVLWEVLVGERLFAGKDGGPALVKSLVSIVEPPSERAPGISRRLDRVVLKALSTSREDRFETAAAMAAAIAEAEPPASAASVAAWVRELAADTLDERGARLFVFDSASRELCREVERPRESMASRGDLAPRSQRRTWALAAAVIGQSDAPPRDAIGEERGAGSNAALGASASGGATDSPAGATASGGDSPPKNDAASSAMSATAASATGAASAQAATSAQTSAQTGTATSPARSAGRAPNARPAPKPDGCDPPFTIDEQGHKRYKRDCLR